MFFIQIGKTGIQLKSFHSGIFGYTALLRSKRSLRKIIVIKLRAKLQKQKIQSINCTADVVTTPHSYTCNFKTLKTVIGFSQKRNILFNPLPSFSRLAASWNSVFVMRLIIV